LVLTSVFAIEVFVGHSLYLVCLKHHYVSITHSDNFDCRIDFIYFYVLKGGQCFQTDVRRTMIYVTGKRFHIVCIVLHKNMFDQ